MLITAPQAGNSSGPVTSSSSVAAGEGVLIGIFVSSSSSGTLKAWDNASAGSGTVLFDTTGTITAPVFLPVNMIYKKGLYITVGGTISCVCVTSG